MSLPLIVSLLAKIDVIEIASWYDAQTPKAGERFLKSLDKKFEMICEHPLVYRAFKNSEIRKCKVGPWPYQVFFTCTGDLIEVIAVIHTARDSKYITQRTEP
jgi:plasmid stabilization system protein ParE